MKRGFFLLPLVVAHSHAATLSIYLPLDGDTAAGGATLVSGTVVGTNATPGDNFTTGKFGQAADFNNNGNSGATPSDWAVQVGNQDSIYTGDFSVSLWVRTIATNDAAIVGNSNWSSGNNTGWVITTLTGGREGKVKTSTGTRQNEALNFHDGGWHLVTLVLDNTTDLAQWYLDGTLLNGTGDAIGSGTLSASLNTMIGGSGTGNYSGTADIDDFAIWSGKLTGDEVSKLWNGSAGNLATAVPETSSALFGCLGAMFLFRRSRRSTIRP
ncbi:LamG domain-containing protein [Luteolibacter arcticus]|uniref:LamG domain-containing protein n=1 Tax=Luteolibacter arcticus TaxID=1581411 RepID=A0ABT3GGC0_9BACT|nr:LamG domain-containing protein [Luteolibacter arcticus]MCW1922658.1 LamG domain-containing protein [Luteolibacter arcticus]